METRSSARSDGLGTEPEIASALELRALRWICEQYAARLDQLARSLGRSPRSAQRYVGRLQRAGFLEARQLLHVEASWVWPTERGARLAGQGFRAWTPHLGRLAHVAAVNEVRLQLAREEPEAAWISERALARGGERRRPRPDAALLRGRQALAVEVELVAKTRGRLAGRLDRLREDYDGVLYFCAPGTLRQLETMRDLRRWPQLEVRQLPLLARVLPS